MRFNIIFSLVVINLSLNNNSLHLHIINQSVFIYTKAAFHFRLSMGKRHYNFINFSKVLVTAVVFKKVHEKTSNREAMKSKSQNVCFFALTISVRKQSNSCFAKSAIFKCNVQTKIVKVSFQPYAYKVWQENFCALVWTYEWHHSLSCLYCSISSIPQWYHTLLLHLADKCYHKKKSSLINLRVIFAFSIVTGRINLEQ